MPSTVPTVHHSVGSPGHAPRGRLRAAVLGLIAVAVTVAVAELVAAVGFWLGVLGPAAAPVFSLGTSVIDVSPGWLVEWAKQNLGAPGDKIFLGVGIGVVSLLFGALVGIVARFRFRLAMTLTAVLALVAGSAIVARTDSRPVDLLALALGLAAGIWFLHHVFHRSVASAAPSGTSSPDWLPAHSGASGSADATPVRSGDGSRRRFVQVAGTGALGALAAGALSRIIPADAAVRASRAEVVLPSIAPRTTSRAASTSSAASSRSSAAGTTSSSASSSASSRASTSASSSTTPTTSSAIASATPSSTVEAGTFDDVPGLSSYVTPNSSFYRIDTAFNVPQITTKKWSLNIHGLVDTPIQLSYDELLRMPMTEAMVTLTCVSNVRGGDLVGNALWQGVRISDVLALTGTNGGADCVLSSDPQGWTCSTPLLALTDSRDALLAIGMNGEPLPLEHGFPVRMVVPGLYGYVSGTKWVIDLEVTKFSEVTAYWTGLGWSDHGPVKLSSRIDVPGDSVSAGSVTVAGVAWAQHTGVEGAQIQINGGSGWGAWLDCELSRPVSVDTWVQWRTSWRASPGTYKIRCRAINRFGNAQIGKDSDVLPDGATGYHQITVVVTA
ncbi:molybdopterin-dependent oxidoreductase [Nakamurella sp. A5-74]|uniref:Molybdopterin-dependent oxidoreductase n=1 Tax=Nakamurella sp. A5-74 TaxID=3158264 RepID=A0AAU8DM92_9ACTN